MARGGVLFGALALLAGCSGGNSAANTSTDTDTTGSTTGTASGSTSPTTSTGPTTTTTGPTTSSSSSGTSTTGTGSTTGGCSGDGECSGDTPYCVEMTCVGCQNAPAGYCGENTPATPACDAGTGTCVECTTAEAGACLGVTPVCDDEANACIACTEHAQCADSACDLETGACMPDDKVWWVDNSTCPGGTGTELDPFCAIADALAAVGNGQPGTIFVRNSGSIYNENVIIDQGKKIALLGTNGQPEVNPNSLSGVAVVATGYVSSLLLTGGTTGLECTTGGVVWVDDSRMTSNTQVGLEVQGCDAHVRRSVVFQNPGGGVSLSSSSEMWMENSVVGSNGGGTAAAAIDMANSTIHVVYTTVAGNVGQFFHTMDCNGGGGDVRNSILSGLTNDSIDAACGGVTFSKNALDTAALMGADNTLVGAWDVGWFVAPGSGNFHLSGNNPFMDVGEWKTGDPSADIDGDARPTVDGTADYVGADVP